MKKLSRLSLEEKMVLGYLPVILVIIFIAAVSLQGLQKLDRINEAIMKSDTEMVQLAGLMTDNLLAQEAYARRYLILQSNEIKEMFNRRNDDFTKLVDKMSILPDRKSIPLAQLASAHDGYATFYRQEFLRAEKSDPVNGEGFDQLIKAKLDNILSLIKTIEYTGTSNRQKKMEQFGETGVTIFRTTLLLSFLGIIMGLGTVTVITRSVSRAIRRLQTATEIVSQGKFDQQADIESEDEIGELAKSFNAMTRRLSLLESTYIDSSPLTRLPGGLAIENILKQRLGARRLLAFCMFDLDNFKSFNDRYGYAKGNEVIKFTAEIIIAAVRANGHEEDFIGHIGGDDFAVIVTPDRAVAICETVIREFDHKVPSFYNAQDRARGYITGHTRQGLAIRFPIMSISIAVATNENVRQMNHIELSEIAAEIKEHAKSLPGSVYVVNRRKEESGHNEHVERFVPKLVK
ncbi:MAG: diguanylate cyclase [Pseudomonadota bacterium]